MQDRNDVLAEIFLDFMDKVIVARDSGGDLYNFSQEEILNFLNAVLDDLTIMYIEHRINELGKDSPFNPN